MYLFMLISLMYGTSLIAAPAHGMLPPEEAAGEVAEIEQAIVQQEAAEAAAARPNEAGHSAARQAQLSEEEKKAEKRNVDRLHAALQSNNFKNILNAMAAVRNMQERDDAFQTLLEFMFDSPEEVRKSYESNPKLKGQFQKDVRQLESLLLKFKEEFGKLPIVLENERYIKHWKPYFPRIFPSYASTASTQPQPIEIEENPLQAEKAEREGKGGEQLQRRGIYPSVQKAPTKPTIERVPTQLTSNIVMLYSKKDPAHKFPVARKLLENENIAGRISGILQDRDVFEVGLDYPIDIVRDLVEAFEAVGKVTQVLTTGESFNELNAAGKNYARGFVENFGQYKPPQKHLVDLLKIANYENSPILTEILARAYARYLHGIQQGPGAKNPKLLLSILIRHDLPTDLLKLVATHYFLQFDEGIDKEVLAAIEARRIKAGEKDIKEKATTITAAAPATKSKLIPIPFDVLVAYGKIPQYLREKYPDLKTNPNQIMPNGTNTPLTDTFIINDPTATKAFLRLRDINPNLLTKLGTPLQMAARFYPLFIPMLVAAGADIEARDKDGYTPLIEAAKMDRENAAKTLIELGANIEARDNDGFTPLMHAVREASQPIVVMLIRKGANVNAHDDSGWTVWKYAQDLHRLRGTMIDLLRTAQVKEVLRVPLKK